jgi:tetratricopeptide (TPR) repeat protein
MLQFNIKSKKLRPFSYEILNGSLARQSGLLAVLVIAGIAMPMMSATAATSSQLLEKGEHYSAIAQAATSTSESGVTVTGQLDDSSPTMESDSSPYNSHTFEGKAGEQIAILLSSQQFDAYLILRGVDGQKLAEDDDSGDGTNALVVVTLPVSGIYTAVANSVDREARGEYRLQWRTATSADEALAEAGQLAEKVEQLQGEGRYSEAIPLAEQVLGLRRRVFGENHPDVATGLSNLAGLYQAQGRYSEAEPLLQQALKIQKTVLSENHPDVAESLNILALIYYGQGRYSEAEPLLQQALKIGQAELGENHPDVATGLSNLAELYRAQGRYSEAEPLLQQALRIGQTAPGENDPSVAIKLNNLAGLYQAQGRYSEAESLYQQALKIWQMTLGENHPNVALNLTNLALLYREQGRYSEAEPLLQQALKIGQMTVVTPNFRTES